MRKELETYEDSSIIVDPNGSYTGKPLEQGQKPIQDADDL